MENKYFTPDIEDIRVGYECEWTSDGLVFTTPYSEPLYSGKLEYSDVLDILKWYDMDSFNLTKIVRVPYLTKEQIEAEGWVWKHDTTHFGGMFSSYEKNNHFLIHNRIKNEIRMIFKDPSLEYDWKNPEKFNFWAECKDINTFRYICKLLGI